jgi:hypothetical protein
MGVFHRDATELLGGGFCHWPARVQFNDADALMRDYQAALDARNAAGRFNSPSLPSEPCLGPTSPGRSVPWIHPAFWARGRGDEPSQLNMFLKYPTAFWSDAPRLTNLNISSEYVPPVWIGAARDVEMCYPILAHAPGFYPGLPVEPHPGVSIKPDPVQDAPKGDDAVSPGTTHTTHDLPAPPDLDLHTPDAKPICRASVRLRRAAARWEPRKSPVRKMNLKRFKRL